MTFFTCFFNALAEFSIFVLWNLNRQNKLLFQSLNSVSKIPSMSHQNKAGKKKSQLLPTLRFPDITLSTTVPFCGDTLKAYNPCSWSSGNVVKRDFLTPTEYWRLTSPGLYLYSLIYFRAFIFDFSLSPAQGKAVSESHLSSKQFWERVFGFLTLWVAWKPPNKRKSTAKARTNDILRNDSYIPVARIVISFNFLSFI